MRNLKTLLFAICLVNFYGSQAQFLKKLTKKAEQAAQRTIENRVEQETTKKTNKTIDSVLIKREKSSDPKNESPPEKYIFKQYYLMQLVQQKDTFLMTSYFGEDENILGNSMEMNPGQKIISVIDLNQNTIHSFLDVKGKKTRTSVGFAPSGIAETTSLEGVSIVPTGKEKNILGYNCKGYQVRGEGYHGTVWITTETTIRYPRGFAELQINNAKSQGIDHTWMTLIDGIALEMDMTVTAKKKPQQVHMQCIALGISDFHIDPSDYKNAF